MGKESRKTGSEMNGMGEGGEAEVLLLLPGVNGCTSDVLRAWTILTFGPRVRVAAWRVGVSDGPHSHEYGAVQRKETGGFYSSLFFPLNSCPVVLFLGVRVPLFPMATGHLSTKQFVPFGRAKVPWGNIGNPVTPRESRWRNSL